MAKAMKLKPFVFFLFLLLIPFFAYVLRPDFVGSDPYAHLMLICRNIDYVNPVGIEKTIFDALPCDFYAIKTLLFLCALVAGIFIVLLARLFSPKNGWKACYLLFLSPMFVLEFAKFENEAFAYPFLFAAVYFFYRGMKTGKIWPHFLAVSLVLFAGQIWDGSIYYLIVFALTSFAYLVFALPAIWIYRERLIFEIIRTPFVREDQPLKLHMLFGLVPGVLGLFFEPLLLFQGLFFLAMGVFSIKFFILSVPYLVVGLVLLLERLKSRNLDILFAGIALFAVVGIAFTIFSSYPTQDHVDAVDYAISLSKNGYINNDWGLGYLVKWRGGETHSFMTAHLQHPFEDGEIVVSGKEPDCFPLKRFGEIVVYYC